MVPNPLSGGSLSQGMLAALPKAQAEVKSMYEAVALAAHSVMVAVDYKLVGLDEDTDLKSHESSELPDSWNSGSSYSFRYSHPQSSLQYIVKIQRLGNKALIHGLAPGTEKTASLEVVASEFLDPSIFPFKLNQPAATSETTPPSRLFLSEGRLSDFAKLFKVAVVQKLTPSLQKEGYEETQSTTERSREQDTSASDRREPSRPLNPDPARPHPLHDPLMVGPPRRPVPDFLPPGFEDEHEMGYPGRAFPPPGSRNPLNIGEGDLYPPGLGPSDPVRPFLGPQGGIGGTGGGMHPTFDDPLFRPSPAFGGGRGGANPPGARYDPVGPGDIPQEPGRRSGFPGGGAGRPPNPFGGFRDDDFI